MPSFNYPQLPKGVWQGVWALLRKTPSRKMDEKALAAELGVQATAAKAYARELMKIGILDEEFRPTDLANRWRQNGKDSALIEEILEKSYPQDLRDLAPVGDIDRDKVIRWFISDGLGEGSAKNKAATYIMLTEGIDEESVSSPAKSSPKQSKARGEKNRDIDPVKIKAKPDQRKPSDGGDFKPELAVNIQIHISADASSDQIDAIFSSMAKYFSK